MNYKKFFAKCEDAEQQMVVELPKSCQPTLELPDPDLIKYYEDLENRIIWVCGDINYGVIYEYIRQIIDYNRKDKDIPVEERKPIRLIVDNIGGALDAAKMFIEIIEMSKTPIQGICIGECASAASMVFLACHKRYCTKNAMFLLHHGSVQNLGGTYDEISKFNSKYNQDIEEMDKFYAEHTGFEHKYIKKKLKEGDWYIYPDEALKKGLIDEIITDMDLLM